MKKLKSMIALAMAAVMALSLLAGCGPQIPTGDGSGGSGAGSSGNSGSGTSGNSGTPDNSGSADSSGSGQTVHELYAPGVTLRMGTGYNSENTGIAFDAGTAGDGITLADGKTYLSGDLKPTWQKLQEVLGVQFENKYQGNSASNEFNYWKERLDQIDVVSGTATLLSENGAAGLLVNIGDYLDQMPNFKAYLEKNPIVKLSIIGDTDTGAIYYSPYFDGVNDIERMPLMRTDWVEKLLNGEGEFTASASGNTKAPVYQPYMPTSGTVSVDVVKADGSGTESVTKDYGAYGNIVEKMNAAGSISGVEAVNMLREYIDATYGGYYGENRADLFIGQNAAWDVDELVALLRCVVSNSQTLNGTDSIQGIFSREENNNSRRMDMIRLAGTLFGVRGVEGRSDWMYVGADGQLKDARMDTELYVAMEKMHALAEEGLISESFLKKEETKSEQYVEQDMGFMSYDYNQTQTIFNENGKLSDGEMYRAVMVPVARWNDGSGESYFRFTESWRSVKTDGWGISADGVKGDDNKLYAALSLIDYAYSPEGQILMSYGPDEFIKTSGGSYVTFSFNGEQWPEIADATRAELWEKQGGNYTNYARRLLGSTLSFVKSQAFEYQCTTEAGRLGAGYISTAIALGTIKHPVLDVNGWYTNTPTTLPTTTVENDTINSYTDLTSQFSTQSGDQVNVLLDIITSGYTDVNLKDAQSSADYVTGSWNGARYISIVNDAWARALDYYNK